MSDARAALAMSFLTRYGSTALNFLSVIILSRLLTPDDIGIYSIGAAVIALAHMLRDFGVPNYVVQEKNLTPAKLQTAAGLAIVVGWSLAVIVFLGSDTLANFYEEPGIQNVLHVLSISFLLIPIGVVSPALLKRDMNFKALFNIYISGTFVNVVSSIVLAFNDFGYMAMAWGSLLGIATTMFVSLYYLPRKYRLPPSFREWRTVLHFSSFNTVEMFVKTGGKSGTELAIGKITDFATLGFYSRAHGYMDIFRRLVLGAVLPVAHALLSRESRASADMEKPYLKVFSMILGVGIPGYFFLAAMSGPVILLLYGEQWVVATTAASLVCLSAIPGLIAAINRQTLLSIGKVKVLMYVSLIVQPIKLAAVIFVASDGLEAIAIALIAGELLHAVVSQYFMSRMLHINIWAWWKELFIALILGVMTVFTPLIVVFFFSETVVVLQVVVGALGAGIGWLAGVWLTGHSLKPEVVNVINKVANYRK